MPLKQRTLLLAGGAAAAVAAGLGVAYLATRSQDARVDVVPPTGDEPPLLVVVLVDRQTGDPIPGGTVRVLGALLPNAVAATESDGSSVFRYPVEGEILFVNADAAGYKSFSKNITVGELGGDLKVTISLDRLLAPAHEISLSIECSDATFSPLSGQKLGRVIARMFRSDGTPMAREVLDMWVDRNDLGGFNFEYNCESISIPPLDPGRFSLMVRSDGTTVPVYFCQGVPGIGGFLRSLAVLTALPVRDEFMTVYLQSQKYPTVSASCKMRVIAHAF